MYRNVSRTVINTRIGIKLLSLEFLLVHTPRKLQGGKSFPSQTMDCMIAHSDVLVILIPEHYA